MPFLVTPEGKFLVSADGKFMVGVDCSCCGFPDNECVRCATGLTWPVIVPIFFDNITGTVNRATLAHEDPPSHPWDGDPLNLDLFATDINIENISTISCTFSDRDLEGNPALFSADRDIRIYVGILRGTDRDFYGTTPGTDIGADPDDVLVHMSYVEQSNSGLGAIRIFWAKIVAIDTDTEGLPDCASLLPLVFSSSDIYSVIVEGSGFISFADLRTATITIGE